MADAHRRRVWAKRGAVALALSLPAACPGLDWPTYRADACHTGCAREPLREPLALRWAAPAGRSLKSAPVVSGGRVVVGSDDGALRCLALADGSLLWKAEAGAPIEAPPLIAGAAVFAGTTEGTLHAFSLSDGARLWTFRAEDRILGAANTLDVAGSAPRLVVGSYDTKVYCLDRSTGAALWSFATDNYVNAAPAVAGSEVLFGGCDGVLRRLAGEDGRELGRAEAGSYIAAPVSVAGGCAFLTHYGGEVLCIGIEDGAVRWRVSTGPRGEPVMGPLAVTEDAVLAGCRDGTVSALDRASGARRWSLRTGGAVDCGVVVCGDRVLFGSADGRLYMVSLADGSKVWSYEVGAALTTPLAVSDGFVLACAEDGRLYAFGPRDAAGLPAGGGRQMPPRP